MNYVRNSSDVFTKPTVFTWTSDRVKRMLSSRTPTYPIFVSK